MSRAEAIRHRKLINNKNPIISLIFYLYTQGNVTRRLKRNRPRAEVSDLCAADPRGVVSYCQGSRVRGRKLKYKSRLNVKKEMKNAISKSVPRFFSYCALKTISTVTLIN